MLPVKNVGEPCAENRTYGSTGGAGNGVVAAMVTGDGRWQEPAWMSTGPKAAHRYRARSLPTANPAGLLSREKLPWINLLP